MKVKNNGENIHLCFICDSMFCAKHNSSDQMFNVDLSNPNSVILNNWAGEDGSQSDNSDIGGFTDHRRPGSIPDGSNFFPSDPSVSPAFDTSSPSAPLPTYTYTNTPMPPYTSPTNTFEQPPVQPMPNPHPTHGSNLNTYNLPQSSDNLFPDLPPSYEVAMMDETDMC